MSVGLPSWQMMMYHAWCTYVVPRYGMCALLVCWCCCCCSRQKLVPGTVATGDRTSRHRGMRHRIFCFLQLSYLAHSS